MKEDQNIEYKQNWQDDCLKWICGFANAQGGRFYIGINDIGKVTGVTCAQKLMEDLPNKIRDTLGIMAEVNLLQDKGADYIEIITQPYSVPISLRGKYYCRSGSTMQELKGNALNVFY